MSSSASLTAQQNKLNPAVFSFQYYFRFASRSLTLLNKLFLPVTEISGSRQPAGYHGAVVLQFTLCSGKLIRLLLLDFSKMHLDKAETRC